MSRNDFLGLLIMAGCVASYPIPMILKLQAQGFVEMRGAWWFPTAKAWQQ